MPEGDSVWLAASRMRTALAGEVLQQSDFRVPRYATVDLRGREVLDVAPRGKHLLTRLSGNLTLHTHFEMDGSWIILEAGARWPVPAWQVRLVLATDRWQAVGHQLPVVDLGPTSAEDRWVGHLGPDVLADDWDLAVAVANVLREPGREIGDALLDQRNVAGPGNIYRTEALFLQGVSPWTQVAEVPDLPALVDRVATLMQANRGSPSQRTTTGPGIREDHWVAGRNGRACLRCGARLQRGMQGAAGRQRITLWCPRCQPEPGRSRAAPD